jgi:hypothetical protein
MAQISAKDLVASDIKDRGLDHIEDPNMQSLMKREIERLITLSSTFCIIRLPIADVYSEQTTINTRYTGICIIKLFTAPKNQ